MHITNEGADAVQGGGARLSLGSIQSHECLLSALGLGEQAEVPLEAAEFQSVVGAHSGGAPGRC